MNLVQKTSKGNYCVKDIYHDVVYISDLTAREIHDAIEREDRKKELLGELVNRGIDTSSLSDTIVNELVHIYDDRRWFNMNGLRGKNWKDALNYAIDECLPELLKEAEAKSASKNKPLER